MAKILLASHSPALPTGYGRVIRMLAAIFQGAGHQVVVVGSDGLRRQTQPTFSYRIISCDPAGLEDAVDGAIREQLPDVLITIGDPWMFETLPESSNMSGVNWIGYFPVDGVPLPDAWARWVRAVDVPVVFSRFTQTLVEKGTGILPPLIYHGVDTLTFSPRDKNEAKRQVGAAGKFVVGSVAANQQRKNLPALVRAFATFAAGKDDVILYLHTPLKEHWDIPELIGRFGLDDKTRLTLGLKPDQGVSDDVLATVYNAMDVFVLPTMAEGFGLPILESQACGVPALATDFSACSELLPNPFQRLRVASTLIMARNFEQAVVDEEEIVQKLEHLYRHPAERAAMGAACRNFAMQFDWQNIAGQFLGLVSSLKPKEKVFRPRFFEV